MEPAKLLFKRRKREHRKRSRSLLESWKHRQRVIAIEAPLRTRPLKFLSLNDETIELKNDTASRWLKRNADRKASYKVQIKSRFIRKGESFYDPSTQNLGYYEFYAQHRMQRLERPPWEKANARSLFLSRPKEALQGLPSDMEADTARGLGLRL